MTSNSILNAPQFNIHSTPDYLPSSLETHNTTSSSNRTVLTPISINSNRKRTLKKNYIGNLTDKNINFIEEENLPRSELEIELDKIYEHKFVLSESNKKDVETYGPMFFFKLFHQNYQILTAIAKSFLALMATSVPCESL